MVDIFKKLFIMSQAGIQVTACSGKWTYISSESSKNYYKTNSVLVTHKKHNAKSST